MEKRRIGIIGSGIGGLGTALLLAKEGYSVTVFEKNSSLGGVCGRISESEFTFDTGPTWFLMADVYRSFFELAGERLEDHLELVRLSEAARVVFEGCAEPYDFLKSEESDRLFFEQESGGSWSRYEKFVAEGRGLYDLAHTYFLHENYDSAYHFLAPKFLPHLSKLGLGGSIARKVQRVAGESNRLAALLSFPSAFLGGRPSQIPGLFSFLSSALHDGVFYPKGGMYAVVEALVRLGKKNGVEYRTNAPVAEVETQNGKAHGVRLADGSHHTFDLIVSAVDASFTETLLGGTATKLKPSYSVLLLYLGLQGKLSELAHHTIFFANDWMRHFDDIESGVLPKNPSLYLTVAGKTDPSVAPPGHENLFALVPIPPRQYGEGELEQYGDFILGYLEEKLQIPDFQKRVVYKKVFGGHDFSRTYNTHGNSALGPAHTLFQSGPWRSNNVHPKIKNLYFAGASTNPGIGIPAVLLSAERVWHRISREADFDIFEAK